MHFISNIPRLALATLAVTLLLCNVALAQDCLTEVFRVAGRQNAYIWTCNDHSTGRRVALSRVSASLPSSRIKSSAHMLAVARCVGKAATRTQKSRPCCADPKRWTMSAAPALRACVATAIPKSASRSDGKVLKYAEGECNVGYDATMSRDFAAFWVCKCRQKPLGGTRSPLLYVVPGHARFWIGDASRRLNERIFLVSECMRELGRGLLHVCSKTPRQFEESALNILRTCCKRVKVSATKPNQACEAALPAAMDLFRFTLM